jgi:hypothetical protein
MLLGNLLVAGTSLAAVSLSRGDNPTQQIGLIALGLTLVAGLPLSLARLPSYEFTPDSSPATTTSAIFGMVHLP